MKGIYKYYIAQVDLSKPVITEILSATNSLGADKNVQTFLDNGSKSEVKFFCFFLNFYKFILYNFIFF